MRVVWEQKESFACFDPGCEVFLLTFLEASQTWEMAVRPMCSGKLSRNRSVRRRTKVPHEKMLVF
jgi:hypothetical protein